jgi:hypothetical protein
MIQQDLFYKVVEMNDFDNVKLLLNEEGVDPSLHNNYALRLSSRLGYTNIVEILLKHKLVCYVDHIALAFVVASENGHLNVVKLLLKEKSYTPAIDGNDAIIKSYQNKHCDVVDFLWKDQRIKDTLINDNKEIYNELIQKDKIRMF